MKAKKVKGKQSLLKNKRVLIIVSLLVAGIAIFAYYSFASGGAKNYHKYRGRTYYIPGATSGSGNWTKAGLTTFGGRCDLCATCKTSNKCSNAGSCDNGISFWDGVRYRLHGANYVALRIEIPDSLPASEKTLLKNFLKHKYVKIKRNTGKKDSKGNWIFKYATGRLDDWGPSSGVVAAAKSRNGDIKTVIDVSPEIANTLGLSNKDESCVINGQTVKYTGIGATDNKEVQIAFWY